MERTAYKYFFQTIYKGSIVETLRYAWGIRMSRIRQRSSNSVLRRVLKKSVILLLIISIPSALFISTFRVEKMDVVGAKRYTADQIKQQVMQTKLDSNTLYLYLKYHYFSNVKMPFVEKIDVDLVDNHSVTLYVYEKMVAGCVEFMGEYLYFDKDGIVVESSATQLEDIPIIRGLEFNKIILNEKLEVQKEELFDVIINMTQLIEKYELDVDTISFSSQYEVTIDCGDVKVLLGKKSTYDEALAELKNILEEAKGMEITIDMRNYVKGTHNIIGKQKKPTE